MSAGPLGCREFRTAMTPPGRSATSTQVPWELLRRLFRQVAPCSSLAGIPLRVSSIVVLFLHQPARRPSAGGAPDRLPFRVEGAVWGWRYMTLPLGSHPNLMHVHKHGHLPNL